MNKMDGLFRDILSVLNQFVSCECAFSLAVARFWVKGKDNKDRNPVKLIGVTCATFLLLRLCLISWDASFEVSLEERLCHSQTNKLSNLGYDAAEECGLRFKEFGGHN